MRALIKSVGITTIFVTHDQEEAMVVGDRIVVMNKGVIEQVGAAQDIYRRPDTAFVANFVGQNNLVPVTATASLMPGCASVQLAGTLLDVPCASHVSLPQALLLALRPEHIVIVDDGSMPAEAPCIRGAVTAAAFLGAAARYEVETALGLSLKVSTPASGSLVPPGQRVALLLDPTRAALVPVS